MGHGRRCVAACAHSPWLAAAVVGRVARGKRPGDCEPPFAVRVHISWLQVRLRVVAVPLLGWLAGGPGARASTKARLYCHLSSVDV